MRLLLDTHVVLLWMYDDDTMGSDVKDLIDSTPEVLVSAASLWELTIKQGAGKLAGPPDLPESILATGLRPLSIDPAHAVAAGRLPPLHRDPFDRMLVAQARVEGLTLATRDRLVQSYDVPVLKV